MIHSKGAFGVMIKRLYICFLSMIMFISFSCSGPTDYISSEITKTGNSQYVSYEIGSLDKSSLQFYEVYMRCSNPNSYSGKNFSLIEYKEVARQNYDEVETIEFSKLVKPNQKRHQLILNGQGKEILELPEDYKSFQSSITNNEKESCFYLFNELTRVEFLLPNSEFPNSKFAKILGVRNFSETDSVVFNMDHFFESGDNLFNLYSRRCDDQWDLDFEIKK